MLSFKELKDNFRSLKNLKNIKNGIPALQFGWHTGKFNIFCKPFIYSLVQNPIICIQFGARPIICSELEQEPIICSELEQEPIICSELEQEPIICLSLAQEPILVGNKQIFFLIYYNFSISVH